MRNEIGTDIYAWVVLHALKSGMTKPEIRDAYALNEKSLDELIDRGIRALKMMRTA